MRKTKEVLRLRFELGLGQRQIARSCGMRNACAGSEFHDSSFKRFLPAKCAPGTDR
jgi:hypothetical protein